MTSGIESGEAVTKQGILSQPLRFVRMADMQGAEIWGTRVCSRNMAKHEGCGGASPFEAYGGSEGVDGGAGIVSAPVPVAVGDELIGDAEIHGYLGVVSAQRDTHAEGGFKIEAFTVVQIPVGGTQIALAYKERGSHLGTYIERDILLLTYEEAEIGEKGYQHPGVMHSVAGIVTVTPTVRAHIVPPVAVAGEHDIHPGPDTHEEPVRVLESLRGGELQGTASVLADTCGVGRIDHSAIIEAALQGRGEHVGGLAYGLVILGVSRSRAGECAKCDENDVPESGHNYNRL